MESIAKRMRAMGSAVNGTLATCVLAFVVLGFVGGILNASLYARVAEYYGIARELSTLTTSVLFLGLFFVATRKPSLLDRRLLTVIALGCAITAVLVLEFALMLGHGPATVLGFVFSSTASAWASILLACSLASLRSPSAALVGVAMGSALGEVVRVIHPSVTYSVGIVEVVACYAIVILMLYRPAKETLDGIARSTAPANLELSNPESFLQPAHALFLCVFLFNIATGYGLTLNEVEHAPVSVDATAIVLVGVALWLMLSGSRGKEDQLFSFSVLLVVAGFIIAPFTFVTGMPSTNALLRIGVKSFDILIWLVVLAVGRRNVLALLPTFALVRSMGALGTDAGAIAGHTTNDLVGTNSDVAMLIAEVVLFAFVAFLWVGFRKFSFTETITGVASMEPSPAVAPDAPEEAPASVQAEASIEDRCSELGPSFGLTDRETEIFAMLARGRNGQYVMDHYVISRNTVKSHVKHIYAKLDVHSQQELIDLVECRG
ncbi:helix-turn-helix transcriptional regulator [uncultured Eggerthella sp.]|nr:helix-turn-helix transcriptional regulator [uncultured Eggerthella sp.]